MSTIDELRANIETHHSDERNLFESITEGSEIYTSETLAQVSCSYSAVMVCSQRQLQAKEHAESTKYYSHMAVGHLDAIKQSTSNLTNNGVKEVSSGNTPRKRKWQYSDEWALTKSRDELLQAWKPCPTSTTKIMELKTEDDQPTLLSGSSTFTETENRDESDPLPDVKSESSDVDVPPPKPLADSRKRNHVLTRARRVR